MPKLVWKGEDHLHEEGQWPPSYNTWNGIRFPKNVPVELDMSKPASLYMLKKAAKEFWDIIDWEPKRGPGRPPKVSDGSDNG